MPQRCSFFLFSLFFVLLFRPLSSGAGETVAPLTLDRAVTLALQHNPRLQASQATIDAAQANVARSRAAFLPTLHLQEVYTRTDDPTAVFGTKLSHGKFSEREFSIAKLTSPSALGSFHSTLSFSQPLYAGGQTQAAFTRAQLHQYVSKLQHDRLTQKVIFAVAKSYYHVLYTQKQLTVLHAAMTTAQTIVNFAQQRFDSGLTVEADVLSTEVRLATLKEKEITTQQQHALAYSLLNNAMGLPLETIWDIDDRLLQSTASPVPTLAELEQRALDQRPDYQQLAFEEQSQQQAVSQAQGAFLPTVHAVASYNLNRPDFLARGQDNWSIGVVAQWNLFNGGADYAALAEARAGVHRMQAFRTQTANTIKLEVREALTILSSAKERIAVAERAVTQAEAAWQIATDRYQVGLTTIVDVLRYEEALTQARSSLSEALYDHSLGWASLGLASGTLTQTSVGMR